MGFFFSFFRLKKPLTLVFSLNPQRVKITLLPQKHKNNIQETGLADWEVRVSDYARDRYADDVGEKVC